MCSLPVLGPPGIIWECCEDFAVRAQWMLLVDEFHDDHDRFGLAKVVSTGNDFGTW